MSRCSHSYAPTRIERPRGRKQPRRLSAKRRTLLEEGTARWGISGPDIANAPPATLDPRSWFSNASHSNSSDSSQLNFDGDIFLEIGFGGGEHLTALAADMPSAGFVGAEVYQGGLANCYSLLADSKIGNVRIFSDDARLLVRALVDNCLSGVFVLFPDPWPKRRHGKRRLIRGEFLDELVRVLRGGGELRLASDDPICQRTLLAETLRHGVFVWQAERADSPAACWSVRPQHWHATRYETKALSLGRTPIYLTFHRPHHICDTPNP